MTTPFARDHPDWQRSISSADSQAWRIAGTQNAINTVHPRIHVGNFPHLYIFLTCDVAGARLTIDWFPSDTSALTIATKRIHVQANQAAEGPIANLGPWVRLTTTLSAAPAIVTTEGWQTTEPAVAETFGGSPIMQSVFQDNVAAFTENVYAVGTVRWGWAHWATVFDNPASWDIKLRAYDYQGVATLIGYRHYTNPVTEGLILLPPMPVRIAALNNTAAAHVFTTALTTRFGPA